MGGLGLHRLAVGRLETVPRDAAEGGRPRGLALAAAVSLGITRFAYGLLLPPMRADLGWSYTLAGAMNTANALGYLLGALATPRLMARFGPSALLLGGALLASVFMGLSGFFTDATALLAQRLLAGVASALVFIAGGLLAAVPLVSWTQPSTGVVPAATFDEVKKHVADFRAQKK